MTDDLVKYAAAIAPQIDRLFIAGHIAARPHANAVKGQFGVIDLGVLVDLRRLLLASTGMTLDGAAALERYVAREDIQGDLTFQVSEGLLRRGGERYWPTERGEALLLALTEALAQGCDDLWRADECTCRTAVHYLQRVIAEAESILLPGLYPAFSAKRRGYVRERENLPMRFWTALDTLRYLRADAHALAWSQAGLTAPEARVLTDVCHKSGVLLVERDSRESRALTSLIEAGLLSSDAGLPTVTEEGSRQRDEVEQATNRHNSGPYAVLSSSERGELLSVLESLPT